jgi:hypothetical protein
MTTPQKDCNMATENVMDCTENQASSTIRELVELIAKTLQAMPSELRSQAHDAAVCALEQQDKHALMAALEPGFIVMDQQHQIEAA